jgi:5-methyltetrahydrofolate--homocysteine methyltransferase
VLAIGTGIEEHAEYGKNFIEAAREIKRRCPFVHLSGGISNLSFSFRGNDAVRERSTPRSCTTRSAPASTWAS